MICAFVSARALVRKEKKHRFRSNTVGNILSTWLIFGDFTFGLGCRATHVSTKLVPVIPFPLRVVACLLTRSPPVAILVAVWRLLRFVFCKNAFPILPFSFSFTHTPSPR
ncbi:unnamed protein product [Amoebophrya sp. A120]|nr:unnamed protein product [Amoebophrya sp. A120]|eukprot:GSA120T00021288001.1